MVPSNMYEMHLDFQSYQSFTTQPIQWVRALHPGNDELAQPRAGAATAVVHIPERERSEN